MFQCIGLGDARDRSLFFPGQLESVIHDSLSGHAAEHIGLDRNFMGRILPEDTADIAIFSFGVLPYKGNIHFTVDRDR